MNHRKLIEIELKKHNIMLEKPNKNSTSTTNTSTCSFKKKSINTKDLLTKIEDYQQNQQEKNRNSHKLFTKNSKTELYLGTQLYNGCKLTNNEIMRIVKKNSQRYNIILNEKLISEENISIKKIATQIQILQAIVHKLRKESYLEQYPTIKIVLTDNSVNCIDIFSKTITISSNSHILDAIKVTKKYTQELRLNQVAIALLEQGRQDIVSQLYKLEKE